MAELPQIAIPTVTSQASGVPTPVRGPRVSPSARATDTMTTTAKTLDPPVSIT